MRTLRTLLHQFTLTLALSPQGRGDQTPRIPPTEGPHPRADALCPLPQERGRGEIPAFAGMTKLRSVQGREGSRLRGNDGKGGNDGEGLR